MLLSYWEKETYFNDIDVAIIGSGIVGLTAAIKLKTLNPALKTVVLERGILPTGASSKNAGFACFGSVSELLDDLSKTSEEETFSLVEKRWRGLQHLRRLLGDSVIDFRQKGGYELFPDDPSFEQCANKINYLNKNLSTFFGKDEVFKIADYKVKEFGFDNVKHIIETTLEGQLDTGKMISALVRKAAEVGVLMLNGITVTNVEDTGTKAEIITSRDYIIKAKKALVCTNGFAKQLLKAAPVNPARAQVLITTPVRNLKIQGAFHYDKGYYYFRDVGQRVLLGGGRNLDFTGEETEEFNLTEQIQNKLEELLKTTILPGADYAIEHRWSGIMGIGAVKKPVVEKVSANIGCAIRLGGMGVAIGSLVGEEGAEMIFKEL